MAGKFKCQYCAREFESLLLLNNHVELEHDMGLDPIDEDENQENDNFSINVSNDSDDSDNNDSGGFGGFGGGSFDGGGASSDW